MRHLLFSLIMALFLGAGLSACIEDGLASSPSALPSFSTDTLKLGTVWTSAPTPTYRFTVYNRHDKILNLSRVTFRDDPDGHFRLNVDGSAGRVVSDVEIRPNDSVFVFVEATLPPTGVPDGGDITRHIDFTTNGVVTSVAVTASARDLSRISSLIISADTTLSPLYPIQVMDSIVVRPGATLTLPPGLRLLFHDKAYMRVEGRLLSLGQPDKRVDLTGDRTGNVVAAIPYDIMSNQWGGLSFAPGSTGNRLDFTTIRNSSEGVAVDSLASLEMRGAILRNAGGYPLASRHGQVTASGCEIAEGGAGVLLLRGGTAQFDHCTIANHYLFSIFGGPAIQLELLKPDEAPGSTPLHVAFSNTIVHGLGEPLSHTDLAGSTVTFTRCLFGVNGADDPNFIRCLWDKDPLYRVDRPKYIFDYHLSPGSPALDAADPATLTPAIAPDGADITPHIGAYGPAAE
ncbi:MAG: hypothetical protein NC342_08230 [Pseudoflavonifractor sp.]|nr:hypothetical protein [Alloprevotella sp.]MCM1117508.1 hypothetical protein [Pseudoflavonifractor sp.]